MVDATKRKLKIPPWHIPYLEKHRIVELYREVVRELVIRKPIDHVLFIKQLLLSACEASKSARVVILCSPKVNCVEVARRIGQITKQTVISETEVLKASEQKYRQRIKSEKLALLLSSLTRANKTYRNGWIIVDVIKTAKDAKKMLEAGVLPTHVLHLIPPFSPPLTEILYCEVLSDWPTYRRVIMEIREVFKSRLIEVSLGNLMIHEVVSKCVNLIKICEEVGPPATPRVVILGPRGCGRKTQAKLISKNLGLIHIDFEYLLCQSWISQTELGEKLRECRDDVCSRSDLLSQVLNKKILEEDCLQKGWVLTGYPFTAQDFRFIDTLDTPPNRVIFLECDPNICRDRLINRRVNVFTGSTTNIKEDTNSIWYKHLDTHPKDKLAMINAELAYYCEQYAELRNYCGNTATIINADQPTRWVYECIVAFIVRDAPPEPTRDPCVEVKLKAELEKAENSDISLPSQLFETYVEGEQAEQKDTNKK